MNRYRFAPSPTGHLHIGGARTALYNFLLARSGQGKFILRIEDTDRERSTQEYETSILEAMKWLGLTWDEGPYCQSERTVLYQEHLQKLLEEGKAYRCFCTAEVIQTKREKALKEKRKPKYDGTCRNLDLAQALQDSRPHCIRFRSPETGKTVVQDLIRGDVEFDNAELDDLIIARTDGTPTYNFVVVIDDLTLKITHVIRGDDHLNNTPRQIQLYEAFAYPIPSFAHIPMILGPDKKRLSKRHGATSVLAYREAGYLPEALLNYLVRLGWACGDEEVFSLEDMIQKFDLNNVGKSATVFNTEKLDWLNGYWIRQCAPDRLVEVTKAFLEKKGIQIKDQDYAQQALVSCQEKVKTLVELADMAAFYFLDEIKLEEKAQKKGLNEDGLQVLRELLPRLEALADFSPESISEQLHKFAEEKELKLGKIAQPLRAALTGSMVSPGIYEVISILGRERVIRRIKALLS